MKARCIEFSGDRATVLLTPSSLRRLFGAETLTIELTFLKYSDGTDRGWYATASRRSLSDVDHSSAIRRALDFRQPAELPRATARLRLLP